MNFKKRVALLFSAEGLPIVFLKSYNMQYITDIVG